MLISFPPPRAFIAGYTALAARKAARRLTSSTWSHSSADRSCGSFRIVTPALFTRMSMRPKVSRVCVTIASISDSRVTSTGIPIAREPSASIWASADAVFSGLRAATTMSAPAAAIPVAIASPSPPFPPVMMATLPSRSNNLLASISVLSSGLGNDRSRKRLYHIFEATQNLKHSSTAVASSKNWPGSQWAAGTSVCSAGLLILIVPAHHLDGIASA